MPWFRSNTFYVSASLFCLPMMAACFVVCLPLLLCSVATLYLIAWATYYIHADTKSGFSLPYHPIRVLKVNQILLGQLIGWFTYLPLMFSYVHWRFWQLGSGRFQEVVRLDFSLDIPFNESCKLDVYHPDKRSDGQLARIIVFIYGGSWGSGSKLLYSTLANTLRELGYVVVVPDYRKYPEVMIDEMYQDIRQAIQWTHQHAVEIHGNPEMIFVMGHSAGAQLTAQVVLSDMIEQVKYDESMQSTPPRVSEKHDPAIKKHDLNKAHPRDFLPLVEGILLFSGVYDIASHLSHETARGVEKLSVMSRVMGGTEEGYKANSPIHLIQNHADLFAESEDLLDLWPRILFLHGQKDTTVNMDQSANMFNTIGKLFPADRRQEVDVRMRLYKRMGHGEPVTALMSNIFSRKTEQALLRDIQEFVDMPQYTDE
ncbi:putative isoprenylcysteine alpha-carbonyl methylesterase ICMEL1 [Choanephora cucurbitarum]|uniref:Putative isoprenylcysteine alpha-carbonyl methylesterase ICMEL1 n=1 Tax=Choanephora cucurbitarum TaxID=101091 RepID=A0A1C7N847_9FUNG|nr:putative isoprenylcysteine alpha-carbonyl methylesterase ICMEL1 [Choanephora cucurbitarum]